MSARFLVIAMLAACAPGFERVAPLRADALAIERIELAWSNAYLVRKGEAAVLVDAGSPRDREVLVAALAARGVAPGQIRAVVVTHAHADHAGCARWLQEQGAAIVLGAGDVAVAARGTNDPLHATNLLGALLAPVFMFPFDGFVPDVAVEHEIDLGDRGFPEVRVVPMPGHTAGSIAAVVGSDAFAGDLVKGNLLVGRQTPSEHLYQTDRLADHASLAALLGRGVVRLHPGHRGPLDAAEVGAWLAGAAPDAGDHAIAIEGDLRGELPRGGGLGDAGGTAGLRVRAVLRRGRLGAGFALGGELRAGYLDGGVYEADVHPLGIALRSGSGAFAMITAGVGLGGARGNAASRASGELAGEVSTGPVRWLARAGAGWALGGAAYTGDAHGIADEVTALIGARLGRDHRWGGYREGHGPYVALTYRNLGGAELFGLALGFEAFAGR